MSPSTMMIVNLISPDGRYDNIFLSNYATIQIRDELGRLPGVANVGYLGERDYSMRAWLDPEKLASLESTADDVRRRHQRAELAGRRRPDRPAAGSRRPAISIDDQHARPVDRSRAVRRHHHQGARATRPSNATGRCQRPVRSTGQAGANRPRQQDAVDHGIVRLRDRGDP